MIKVSFSPPCDDLVNDVSRDGWLDGNSRISTVVFINIDEDTRILRKIQAFILEPKSS